MKATLRKRNSYIKSPDENDCSRQKARSLVDDADNNNLYASGIYFAFHAENAGFRIARDSANSRVALPGVCSDRRRVCVDLLSAAKRDNMDFADSASAVACCDVDACLMSQKWNL